VIDGVVDRALNRTLRAGPWPVAPELAAFHERLTVVDLLVGTALFRRGFLPRLDHGHLDLPRARLGGLDVIGLTVATRFNDLRGTLSRPHFRALGIAPSALDDDLALAEALLDRIEGWVADSTGRLTWWQPGASMEADRLDRPMVDRPVLRCFAGIQGGQVVAPDLGRIERLARRGVRMLGLAHVMDTPLAGSGTGRGARGLTPLGRDAIAEAERVGVLVDLAHASVPAIEDALRVARRPIVISHTGFTTLAGGRSRWRRYSPATRNLPDGIVREAGAQGALVGVTFAVDLVGGPSMASVVRSVAHAVELVGSDHVAIGSDFDGALRMPFDVRGLPALTGALLDVGLDRQAVAGIMGANALRSLERAAEDRGRSAYTGAAG
jgi:microsomal dipeptidase-like Zn-dependent dipeptidase